MSGATISDILSFLRSQLAFHPPFPTSTFEGQTVIVTGANTGLGREAAKHIVRLGAKLVILAVRDLCKGQAASEYVATQTGITDVIQVWQLDLSSFTSVQDFARRATALTRLDAVVENAGMWPIQFESFEGHE
jgi:retinol dehydrogenase-12